MSVLAARGRFKEACTIFQIMKKDGVKPTVITFQKLVLACQKSNTSSKEIAGNLENILTRLDDYEKKAVMSGPVYNMLIRTYGNLNDFDNALRIYQSVDRASTQILNSILFVCSAVSPVRWQDAIILLHTSDIVDGAAGRGQIEYSALSYAVIACSKENQWQVRNEILLT
jgi:pentatricopeptide repeat protein